MLVSALSTHKPLRALYFLNVVACMRMHTSGWAVEPAGSNALYHAKLDWIKVWTRWERTVLMKGIFSTFGSVKSPLLNRTGNKMRGHAFYSLSRNRLFLSLTATQLQKLNKDREQSDNQKVVLSAELGGRLKLKAF